ncbi:hypothetical protein FHW03_004584 [Ochrobactrum sp. RH2CCR150]|nr:hypothetical protein [Ochrobactrum sp. RH2CCR150]
MDGIFWKINLILLTFGSPPIPWNDPLRVVFRRFADWATITFCAIFTETCWPKYQPSTLISTPLSALSSWN